MTTVFKFGTGGTLAMKHSIRIITVMVLIVNISVLGKEVLGFPRQGQHVEPIALNDFTDEQICRATTDELEIYSEQLISSSDSINFYKSNTTYQKIQKALIWKKYFFFSMHKDQLNRDLPFTVYSEKFKDGEFVVIVDRDYAYILQGGSGEKGDGFQWSYFYLTNEGEKLYPVKGFLPIEGKAKKPEIESQTNNFSVSTRYPDILRQFPSCNYKAKGEVIVRFRIGDRAIDVNLRIIELPFSKGSSVDDLLVNHGFPEDKMKYYISWPCSRRINGYFYTTDASYRDPSPDHWMYSKWPNAVIELTDNKVTGIGTLEANPILADRNDGSGKLNPNQFSSDC